MAERWSKTTHYNRCEYMSFTFVKKPEKFQACVIQKKVNLRNMIHLRSKLLIAYKYAHYFLDKRN